MSMGEGDTIVLPGSYGCVLRLLLSRARLNAHIITHEQKYRVRTAQPKILFSNTKQKLKLSSFFLTLCKIAKRDFAKVNPFW